MINLEDLVPQEAEFTLKTAPGETFKMRPVSIEDNAWMVKKFGSEGVQQVFKKVLVPELMEIAYHQLTAESREFFVKRKVSIVNEEGEKVDTFMGGVTLFRSLIQGPQEAMMVVRKVLETVGVSQPIFDKIEQKMAEKKSLMEAEPTGERSSISSQPSTDGPLSTSSAAP